MDVSEYAANWLTRIGPQVRPRSLVTYRWLLRSHVLPAVGHLPIAALSRAACRHVLTCAEEQHLALGTLVAVRKALVMLLEDATEHELLPSNPARGVGREILRRARRGRTVTALTAAQAHGVEQHVPEALRPLFATMARAGLRVGEARALQPDDVDCDRGLVSVQRTVHLDGRLGPPKGGRSRTVDATPGLVELLRPAAARGGPWLFPSPQRARDGPVGYHTVRRAMRHACEALRLPDHGLHVLRHTYATLLVSRGAPMAWVQQALGHSSVQITVDLYGSHARAVRPAVLDSLDAY
jgi:integrase